MAEQVDLEELEALTRACPDDTGMGYCAACSYTIGQCACATRYQFRYGTKKPTILALLAELRSLRQAQPQGWVATSERMPEILHDDQNDGCSEWVHVYAPQRGVDMAFWADDGTWTWRESGYAIESEITHWMPLPSPPEAR